MCAMETKPDCDPMSPGQRRCERRSYWNDKAYRSPRAAAAHLGYAEQKRSGHLRKGTAPGACHVQEKGKARQSRQGTRLITGCMASETIRCRARGITAMERQMNLRARDATEAAVRRAGLTYLIVYSHDGDQDGLRTHRCLQLREVNPAIRLNREVRHLSHKRALQEPNRSCNCHRHRPCHLLHSTACPEAFPPCDCVSPDLCQ